MSRLKQPSKIAQQPLKEVNTENVAPAPTISVKSLPFSERKPGQTLKRKASRDLTEPASTAQSKSTRLRNNASFAPPAKRPALSSTTSTRPKPVAPTRKSARLSGGGRPGSANSVRENVPPNNAQVQKQPQKQQQQKQHQEQEPLPEATQMPKKKKRANWDTKVYLNIG